MAIPSGILRQHGPLALIVLILLASAGGCTSAEAKKQRHLERGDRYAAEERDEFAAIEYANAVRLDPKSGEAHLKLAKTYERLNNLRAAYPAYIRAADALPDDRQVQIKATELLLLTRRFEDAKDRASRLLEKNPNDVDAIVLRANALAGLKDLDGAIKEIEEALKIDADDSRAFVELASVRMRSGDDKQAEVEFRKAISLQPEAIEPHLALSNFLWSVGRRTEAEEELKLAQSLKPQHLLANRMLASLYMSTGRAADAEQPLKTIADVSQLPTAKFQLADYYLKVARPEAAIQLLNGLAGDRATAAAAETALASIDYDAGRHDAAHTRLDTLLARWPNDTRALVLKARWLTSEHRLDEALEKARAAVKTDEQSAAAQYALARVHDLRREPSNAAKAYTEVLKLNPRASAAQVALSRLNLASGNTAAALRYAEEAKSSAPASTVARAAVARSLITSGDLARAESEIAALFRAEPNSAAVHALNGNLQFKRRDYAAAKAAFERALALTPGYYDGIAGLASLDIVAKRPDQALRRVEAALAVQPDNVELLALASQLYSYIGQADRAEQSLRRAVTADPRFTNGYAMLAQLYISQKRLDEARAEYEGLVKRDPKSPGPRTMVGVILESQGKREEAKAWYSATVAEISDAPVAANNLAYIYAEEGSNLDLALQLASLAKQLMPDSSEVDDTLGWVYYKKNLPTMAVKPLEDSLKKMPQNPEILYHLGLTYAQLGEKAKARDALERALKINPGLAGAAAVRRTLASLSQ